jgi:hypothetical protein
MQETTWIQPTLCRPIKLDDMTYRARIIQIA